MKKKIRSLLAFFCVASSLMQSVKADNNFAAWLYNFSVLDNQATVTQLQTLNIDQAYLAVSAKKLLPNGEIADAAYTDKLSQFLSLANAQGIQVHAMTLMDKNFSLVEKHQRAADMVSWIIDFNNAQSAGQKLVGIHIDTEPHTLSEWKAAKSANDWDTVESIMAQYVELLTLLDPIVHSDPQLSFSAAIHWKYNEWAARNRLPSGDTAILRQYLDVVMPMVYETDSLRLIQRRSADEIEEMPTLIGIRAVDFENYDAIIAAKNELDANNADQPHYLGVIVHSFSELNIKYLKN